ncbi:hypothetical protein ACQQ2N_07110 [Dokdonella sp. MW10]|uniref:hypothetical protein n=1 Tax=Dokdonella sp. MW10 TaxID=2992926 RepID=UPI003F7FA6C5
MTDTARARKLARQGFESWTAGLHEQSAVLYEQALALADPNHGALSDYHAEYAAVLNVLGRRSEATEQMELAIVCHLKQGDHESSRAVIVARHFLAEHMFGLKQYDRALEVITPSVIHAPHDWLARFSEARALFALGRQEDAEVSATLAIRHAPTPDKAAELARGMTDIISGSDQPDVYTRGLGARPTP